MNHFKTYMLLAGLTVDLAERDAEAAEKARDRVAGLLDGSRKLALAKGYVFDPNPVFWALGPHTLRVSLEPASGPDRV